ncbi:hypothetical protein MT325_M465L [Paramecium bursaria chlorella virus MT325]|uniref:Uncharacterized protein M465L n=1 Tax=Paramecium bursaria Chlorella virus MT325 TaxID=346932 RepID=A7IUJ5_PBCVM|nr:hypothetical protein MT325_M465L [Paramecium bursaria chlorella virus MT325]
MGFIYKLMHKESRKAYIGQTTRDIEERLKEHQLPYSGCKAISSAIQKHGWENFDKEWYEVPDEDLNFYEEMLVALFGTLSPGGYNLMEGGGSTGKRSEETKQKMREAHVGMSHTEETKEKMKEAKTGEKHPMFGKEHTEESKQKMREANSGEKNPMFGKEHIEETKQKISEAKIGEKNPMYGKIGEKNHFYGKEHTEESKKKMSDAHTGKTLSEETKKKLSKAISGEKNHASKKVYQYTIGGIYVDDFGSCGEAARSLGKTDGSNISKCAHDKLKSAYGFKWSHEKL